jgi:hypothetical protein
MSILKYIQSEDFGKFGESMQLIDTIQVSSHKFRLCLGIHQSTSVWEFKVRVGKFQII